ncbi:MAG TPA: primosomal protein N' [bacterium]|nr:primosomal protein N' [bacterium]
MEGNSVVEVAVPIPIDTPLTYLVPPGLEGRLRPGMRVVVEVKRKVTTGFVVGVGKATRAGRDLKRVREVLDPDPVLGPELIQLAGWISQYYIAPLGEVLAAMSPPAPKLRQVYRLKRHPGDLELEIIRASDLLKSQIIEAVSRGEGAPLATIKQRVEAAGGSVRGALGAAAARRAIGELVKEGVLASEVVASRRRTSRARPESAGTAEVSPRAHRLTGPQQAALDGITRALGREAFEVFLLFGVTGSGKTEVYLRAIAETVRQGKQAIYLAPEIALTPQIMSRVEQWFGEKCAVLHSKLSDGERARTWARISAAEVDVVVGARSAIFAPLARLGLVVVDEEHEASYKQQDSPRYNAREVAIIRARSAGAVVILGSATPTIETYYNAASGKYTLHELPERISGGALPEVAIVDMRASRTSPGAPFSEAAERQIGLSLADQEQVVLFLNRRGFSNYVQCLDCGFVPRCRNCQVTLTYHLARRELVCHYCDYREPGWDACPKCKGANIDYVGLGTQKIEDYVSKRFPLAACARFDRDSTRKKGSSEALLGDFADGMVRMLVGTQMLAKGHDFRAVGLVVVVNADVTMNLPDFRSGERTFQIVTQVAGRAGRGEIAGKVIIQTLNPDHHALKHACRHDFKSFYNEEIAQREELYYPPFARLARVVAESKKEALARDAAREFVAVAERLGKGHRGKIEVMGPSRAPISKVKNVYRWHLVVKGDGRAALSNFLRACLDEVARRQLAEGVRLVVDVDPQVML